MGDENDIKRIPLRAGVQQELEQLFDEQEQAFLGGRDEEIPFDGDWKPDGNELLVIEDADLAAPFGQTLVDGPAAYQQLDVTNYADAGIKGIFTRSEVLDGRLLLQRFQTSQYLQKSGLTLVFSNNQFGKLSENGFALDARLAAVIEGNHFKFLSFRNLRTILTIQHHFEQATETEIAEFRDHASFHVENAALFDAAMDERSRKLICGISRAGILNDHDAQSIQTKAGSVGLQIDMQDGRLVLPGEKRRLKTILSFLEESVYKGVFSDETFQTNSKRPVQ
ncbi:hypothetical protein [uncultured Roseobacter sp.]|uniref:hypothetical protein n=1 Tax=uncultured Roseobacter sp. TaxID=114847 RepID=UPI002630E892|nr:hypothetical protein [uncultured Roseobacter sp.]